MNSHGEEWCLCKSKLGNVTASKTLLPPGCPDASRSSSQLYELSQGVMFSLQSEDSFPCMLPRLFWGRGMTKLGEGRTLPIDMD